MAYSLSKNKKRNIVKSAISEAKDRTVKDYSDLISGTKEIVKNYSDSIKSNITSASNIGKLIQKYGISTPYGYNYNIIKDHLKELFKKGKAKEARQYLKQQQRGIKGTNIIEIEEVK